MIYALQFIAAMATAFVAISAMTSPRIALTIYGIMAGACFIGLIGFAALVFVVAYY
jgi:hypothetical protein